MAGKYLLDTNILISLLAEEAGVLEKLAQTEEAFLSSITTGELYYGALRSSRVEQNVRRVDEISRVSVAVACDAQTARRYAGVKNALRLKGRLIPENAIWIAAVALQHARSSPRATRTLQEVECLAVEQW